MSNINEPFRNDVVQRVRREIEHGMYENAEQVAVVEREVIREVVASTRIPPPARRLHPECIPCSEANAIAQRIVGASSVPGEPPIDRVYAQSRLMARIMWTGIGILIAVAIVTKLTN